MNERYVLKQLAELGERVARIEADLAALKAVPTPNAPEERRAVAAPSIPRRTKGAKDG